MAEFSKITLPDNVSYDVKDETARTSLESKQDVLTAGTNITITDNVISATGSGNSFTYDSTNETLIIS